MEPGSVVWLPDGGFDDYNAACQDVYGYGYYYCAGPEPDNGGVDIWCRPYQG